MHLDLSDEETAALIRELHDIVESDRYPFSPPIRTLREILGKLRPEPGREPLPPTKVYAPPQSPCGPLVRSIQKVVTLCQILQTLSSGLHIRSDHTTVCSPLAWRASIMHS